ncbi:MAG TPA: polysulfide reductase NrfD [Bacteroidales bacterium]|nr:polysulfide reductase NrfD [Bacteroidales bacterium]HNQ83007.1 polysulfide reductase NrfD [Bacteroidales bacterium]HOX76706.1 polysulfide reductase NrfD [Bacteroidales bacterium]HPI86337.1 polysulfide reductase NrfD [Bacteroidales bacterium]HPM91941.1 polysulfide reductase NrfD [Bacteroidales bacterium]
MKEELFVSGRDIPNIDPFLNIWHWQIPIYLYLGGLAAGILFFAGIFTILNKEKEMPATVKWAPMLVPGALVIGLLMLFLDLKHQLFFWRLYTTVRFESPMSWGAWVLMAVTPLSFIWAATYIKEIRPEWNWKFNLLEKFEAFAVKNRKPMAWIFIVLSVVLGIYTGILLSAFNARPLWNNSILGPLFLVSGLSTGTAVIMWITKNPRERIIMSRIDLVLIIVELFFITHMMMGMLAGSSVQIAAAGLFLGGQFTVSFWVFVIVLGLVFPAVLEILELAGFKIPVAIPALLILFGGLVFRFIMVEAGQITRYLY